MKPSQYKAVFPNSFKKSCKGIPQEVLESAKKAIIKACENPKSLSDKVKNPNLPERKIRVGNYRILFDINEEKKELNVLFIKHRKECYE